VDSSIFVEALTISLDKVYRKGTYHTSGELGGLERLEGSMLAVLQF
jgi:hypothetical protein